jgi:hypothetical protein
MRYKHENSQAMDKSVEHRKKRLKMMTENQLSMTENVESRKIMKNEKR